MLQLILDHTCQRHIFALQNLFWFYSSLAISFPNVFVLSLSFKTKFLSRKTSYQKVIVPFLLLSWINMKFSETDEPFDAQHLKMIWLCAKRQLLPLLLSLPPFRGDTLSNSNTGLLSPIELVWAETWGVN